MGRSASFTRDPREHAHYAVINPKPTAADTPADTPKSQTHLILSFQF